jgi:hypothetical protein
VAGVWEACSDGVVLEDHEAICTGEDGIDYNYALGGISIERGCHCWDVTVSGEVRVGVWMARRFTLCWRVHACMRARVCVWWLGGWVAGWLRGLFV